MGLSFSCPFAAFTDLETDLKSISLEDGEVQSLGISCSFKSRGSESMVMPLVASQKMRVEGSLSFKVSSAEEKGSNHAQEKETTESPRLDNMLDEFSQSSIFDSGNPKHEAALKLQKVYKSFRTRRKLADCAVLIEQSWWKILDFAELKRSSVSFFDIDKHETAVSRWSRARTRAAKVGKGLSKNCKAQKLALQHWLEAIDPRHRYGHNLHFYYGKWLHSQSKEPFFYWLDIGEGKEVNIVEKCPRSKLQQQCIKYLGSIERKAYEVVIEDGKLLYKQTQEFIDTTREPKDPKWIFVLSTSRTLYIGMKKKGSFQHSSFLAGGATLAAGRIVAEGGVLKAIWPHSGHYRPTHENFQDFVSFLHENGVDTTYVKMDSDDDEKDSLGKKGSSVHIRTHSSEEDTNEKEHTEEVAIEHHPSEKTLDSPKKPRLLRGKLETLEIPNKDDLFFELKTENHPTEAGPKDSTSEHDLSDDEEDEPNEETVHNESILQRINSHKGTSPFQMGRQLSCKWSTGAGPRIGCLRDYPTELQSHTLEEANLSPRSAPCSVRYTNKVLSTSPCSFGHKSLFRRNSRPCRTQSSPLNTGTMSFDRTGDFTELFD